MELSLINSSWSRIVFWNTDPRLYTCAKPAKPAKLQCKHPMQCIGTNTSPRATRAGGAAGQSKYRIKNKKMKNKRQGKETPGTNERRRRRKKRKKKKKKKKKIGYLPWFHEAWESCQSASRNNFCKRATCRKYIYEGKDTGA